MKTKKKSDVTTNALKLMGRNGEIKGHRISKTLVRVTLPSTGSTMFIPDDAIAAMGGYNYVRSHRLAIGINGSKEGFALVPVDVAVEEAFLITTPRTRRAIGCHYIKSPHSKTFGVAGGGYNWTTGLVTVGDKAIKSLICTPVFSS